MIHWLRNILLYFLLSGTSTAIARWNQSTVVIDLLVPNLITIVVALLAINVQTVAIISTKLREIADKTGNRFGTTVAQFRLAFTEQVGLVLISLLLSSLAKGKNLHDISLVIDLGAFFVIYAALHIFLDTSLGLLVALFPESE